MKEITPYPEIDAPKKSLVAKMFNNIAPKYDFLNRFLSVGIDTMWRKKMLKKIPYHPQHMLDVATGTGDLVLLANKYLAPAKITAVDIADAMIEIGRKKAGHLQHVSFATADAENLPFPDNHFDLITVAFGIRNFENLKNGLKEMHRVLQNDKICAILEFSIPANKLFKGLYIFYFRNILPFIGRIISGDPRAYTYLFESVQSFPYGENLAGILIKSGFKNVQCFPLTGGIATIYIAKK